ncbi:MAG: hypothetical protein R3261_11890, partial [Alphaproteobacteria bacterium]|nr:hypothetical protein [Alphaproteobacteria bacterium]
MASSTIQPAKNTRLTAGKNTLGTSIQIDHSARHLSPYYGIFIRVLKLVLPTMALALIVIVILWPLLEQTNQFDAFTQDPNFDSSKLQVFDASYGGFGDKGSPYTVTAE